MKNYLKRITPLTVIRFLAAAFVAVGCFLGFPNDEPLSGAFWVVVAVDVLLTV